MSKNEKTTHFIEEYLKGPISDQRRELIETKEKLLEFWIESRLLLLYGHMWEQLEYKGHPFGLLRHLETHGEEIEFEELQIQPYTYFTKEPYVIRDKSGEVLNILYQGDYVYEIHVTYTPQDLELSSLARLRQTGRNFTHVCEVIVETHNSEPNVDGRVPPIIGLNSHLGKPLRHLLPDSSWSLEGLVPNFYLRYKSQLIQDQTKHIPGSRQVHPSDLYTSYFDPYEFIEAFIKRYPNNKSE